MVMTDSIVVLEVDGDGNVVMKDEVEIEDIVSIDTDMESIILGGEDVIKCEVIVLGNKELISNDITTFYIRACEMDFLKQFYSNLF